MALTTIPGSGIDSTSVVPAVLTEIQSSFNSANSTLTVPNLSATTVSSGNVKTDNLLYANGSAYAFTSSAAGSNTQVQFNNNSSFAGSANLTFDTTTNTLTATNFAGNGSGLSAITGANVSGTVANATYAITSGSATVADTANAVAGANVSGAVANATYALTSGSATTAGTVTTNAQPNITSVGTLTTLVVTGNITSGNAILGNAASANYFVGNGSLLTGISTTSSSIVNGNSNVTVSANSNVTMSVAGIANVVVVATDGITVAGNISANTITTSGGSGNISGANVIAGVTLIVTGNITSGNAALGNAASANYFLGNGALLTGISTTSTTIFNGNSNVSVPTANGNVNISVAGTANVVVVATTGITVAGNISANTITTSGGSGNISGANVIAGVTLSASGQLISTVVTGTAPLSVLSTTLVPNLFVANAAFATSAGSATTAATANAVAGANVSGTVANATYALTSGSSTTAATVTTNAQPNITSVGTLTSLITTGNITSGNAALGNLATANFFTGSGNLLSNIQGSNVTGPVSFATTANAVAGANVSGTVANATYALTSGSSATAATVTTNAQPNITSVGTLTSLSVTGNISGANIIATSTLASTSKTTGALTVAGGVGVAGDLYAGNSITVDGGAYGNVVTTQFAGVFATANGPNPYSIMQVRSNDGTTGMGMQAYAGLPGLIYSSGNIVFQTGATARDKDFPTGGTTRTTINTTGLSVTGIVSATGNINSLNANLGNAATANYFVGDGSLLTGISSGGTPGGANTQLQFNDANVFGGSAGLTFNKTTTTLVANNLVATSTANLGAIGNITITGGTGGYVLATNGSGTLTWIDPASSVTSTSPTTAITVDNFVGNGVATTFALSVTPEDIAQTMVNYNGIMLLRSAYSLAGNTIIFSEAPIANDYVEVTTTMGVTINSGTYVNRTYTGDGSTTMFTVTAGATASSLIVSENGLVQRPTTDYTTSGSLLTFVTAPLTGVIIQIRELGVFVVNPSSESLSPFLLMGA